MGNQLALARPDIRTTYHLSAELRMDGKSVDESFAKATQTCLRWVKDRYPESLPAAAMRGESASMDLGAYRLDLVGIPDTGHWSMRLTHPDVAFKDRPAVPGRSWMIDLALAKNSSWVHLAAQVRCMTPAGVYAPILHTRPRPIADLARAMQMYAPIKLTPDPLAVTREADLALLRNLLVDPKRELPVVVLTNPRDPDLKPWVVDPSALASKLLGQAHVVLLPQDLTYAWSDTVTKPWGVYQGAIRIYKPGLNLETQSAFSHPLATLDKILGTATKAGQTPEDAFAERLVEDVGRILAEGPRKPSEALFVTEAQAKAAEIERQKVLAQFQTYDEGGRSASVQAQINIIKTEYEKELASLRQQLLDSQSQAEWMLEEATKVETDRDRLRGENESMRWQLAELREAVVTGTPVKAELPTTYEAMPEWVERNLAGRLVLHPRAKRELKDAKFEDVELVYKSLLALANDYQPMRMGLPGAKDRYERTLTELKLWESGSIDPARAGAEGKEYKVKWPHGDLRAPEVFVDRHLRNGNSRDPRHCLCVYFFYDKESSQVVVCSLPRHLDNQLT
jgi:hypothetical protein